MAGVDFYVRATTRSGFVPAVEFTRDGLTFALKDGTHGEALSEHEAYALARRAAEAAYDAAMAVLNERGFR